MKKQLTLAAIGAMVIAFIGLNTFFVVPQTHQALVVAFGKPKKTVEQPGISYKVPFFQQVEFFDKRLLEFSADAKEVIAADQKRLVVDAFVRYRITNPLKFKQAAGSESVMQDRLNRILESTLRQTVADIPLAALISTERPKAMAKVKEMVNAIVSGRVQETPDGETVAPQGGFGIEVVDVRIVRADLPQANSESVFQRMRTERDQEAKEFRAKGAEDAQKIRATADKEKTILLAEAQKKAEILKGEGDAAAVKIFAEAVGKSPELYTFFRSLQAYRKTLTETNTAVVLSPSSEFLKYMDKGAPQ